MAQDKKLTSNGQGKQDTKPMGNAKDTKTPVKTDSKNMTKPEAKADAKPEAKAEPKADPNKKEVVKIDDISSPSLEIFNLKQKGKILHVLKRKDLEAQGFPVYDAAKFDKRNTYTNHVKHVLMNALKEGKITTLRHEFRFDEGAAGFPEVKVTPPAPKLPKKTGTSSTSSTAYVPDAPVSLEGLNFEKKAE